jgi:hypothetical protein
VTLWWAAPPACSWGGLGWARPPPSGEGGGVWVGQGGVSAGMSMHESAHAWCCQVLWMPGVGGAAGGQHTTPAPGALHAHVHAYVCCPPLPSLPPPGSCRGCWRMTAPSAWSLWTPAMRSAGTGMCHMPASGGRGACRCVGWVVVVVEWFSGSVVVWRLLGSRPSCWVQGLRACVVVVARWMLSKPVPTVWCSVCQSDP